MPNLPPIQQSGRSKLSQLPCSRLARRGGVKRIKRDIYDTMRAVLKARLTLILHHVVAIVKSDGTQSDLRPRVDGDSIHLVSRNERKVSSLDPDLSTTSRPDDKHPFSNLFPQPLMYAQTVTTKDVVYALRVLGTPIWGFPGNDTILRPLPRRGLVPI